MIVGAGPTGVETAGALADLVNQVMPKRFHDLDVKRTRIYLVDHGPVVLAAFSDKAHAYAADKLRAQRRASCKLGTGVTEIAAGQGDAERRHGDPDPHRRLGRRHPGARAGRQARARRRAEAGG